MLQFRFDIGRYIHIVQVLLMSNMCIEKDFFFFLIFFQPIVRNIFIFRHEEVNRKNHFKVSFNIGHVFFERKFLFGDQ